MAERLAGDGRIVEQLLPDELADQLVVREFVLENVAVGEVGDPADAVGDDDAVELVVGFRVAHDAEEGREPRARAEQEERRPGRRLSVTNVPVGLRPTMISRQP